ncbi:MAG: hypothetical protein HFG29_05015 [Eubacterium sp.]|nr:hypothetical protein [Eubacterium sp.]
MKKKKIFILIDTILYIIFSILYSSKGFALMLAEEMTREHVVYNKYGKSYSYLNFKPISIILYRVGALGLILTGIIFIVLVTRVTYAEIKKLKIASNKDTCKYEPEKSVHDISKNMFKNNVIKKYGSMILIAIIYVLILYSIPLIIENNFFTEVGTEGVYFN